MQSCFILRMLDWITNQLAVKLKLVFDLSCSIRMITELEYFLGTIYSAHSLESTKNFLYLSSIHRVNDKNAVFVIYLSENLPDKRLVFRVLIGRAFVSSDIFDATFDLTQSLLMSKLMRDTSSEKEHDFTFVLFKLSIFKNLKIKLADVFSKGFSTATSCR